MAGLSTHILILSLLGFATAGGAWAGESKASPGVPGSQPITIFRIYNDTGGKSHIERNAWNPQPDKAFGRSDVLNTFFLSDASHVSVVGGEPGFSTPAHNTGGGRALIFILQGSSSATTSDGHTQRFKAGDIILLDDPSGPGAAVKIGPRGYLGLAVMLSSSGTVTAR